MIIAQLQIDRSEGVDLTLNRSIREDRDEQQDAATADRYSWKPE